MSTQNRNARHNLNWHARPANEAIEFVERVDLHTALRRWIAHEPLAYVDGQNLYEALPDNPINAVNPLGD